MNTLMLTVLVVLLAGLVVIGILALSSLGAISASLFRIEDKLKVIYRLSEEWHTTSTKRGEVIWGELRNIIHIMETDRLPKVIVDAAAIQKDWVAKQANKTSEQK